MTEMDHAENNETICREGPSIPLPDNWTVNQEGVIDCLTVKGQVYDWEFTLTVTPEQYARWPLLIRPKPKADTPEEQQEALDSHKLSVENVGMLLLIACSNALDDHDSQKLMEGETHQVKQMHHWPLGHPEGLDHPPGLTLIHVVEAAADYFATTVGRAEAGRGHDIMKPTSTLSLADSLMATQLWLYTETGMATVTYKKISSSGNEVSS